MSHCPNLVGKWLWPELVGVPGEAAVATIERENPTVNATVVPPGTILTQDLRCDRVRVFVDARGNVDRVPFVG